MATRLSNLRVTRVDLVDKGANESAHVMIFKADMMTCPDCGEKYKKGSYHKCMEKAVWTAAFINDLPDSSFAYIEPGGKKVDGKTEPRSLRHLPYKDASGKVDPAHVRNALSRLPQTQIPADAKDKAKSKLEAALSSIKKDGGDDPMMFNDAMMAQKMGDMARCMDRHYSALMDSVYSIMRSAGGKDKIMESYKQFESSLMKELDGILTIGDGEAKKSLMDGFVKQVEGVKAKLEALSGGGEVMKITKIDDAVRKALPEGVRALLEAFEKGALDATANGGAMLMKVAADGEVTFEKVAAPPAKEEDIWKGADPRLKAQYDALQAETKKAQEAMAKQAESVMKADFIAKIASFKNLVFKSDTDWEIFKAVMDKDPKLYDRLAEVLKGADAAVATAKLFKAHGTDSLDDSGDDTVMGQVNKAVAEIVKKNDKISRADALSQVFKANPALFEQYRRESFTNVKVDE